MRRELITVEVTGINNDIWVPPTMLFSRRCISRIKIQAVVSATVKHNRELIVNTSLAGYRGNRLPRSLKLQLRTRSELGLGLGELVFVVNVKYRCDNDHLPSWNRLAIHWLLI